MSNLRGGGRRIAGTGLAWALFAPALLSGQGLPCFHPISIGVNGGHPELIRSAHAGWLRTTIRWAEVEPLPGVWTFERLDGLIEEAGQKEVAVLAILSTAPVWAGSNPNGTLPPADLALWRQFVRRTAARYRGRVAAYEVWNEPNLEDTGLGIGWALPLDASPRYVDYLRAAAEEVRAEAPGTRVVGPATSSLPDSRTVEVFTQLEAPFPDGRRGFEFLDAVSFHANALDGEGVPEIEGRVGSHLSTLFHRSPGSRDKPIWITELGWKSNRVGEDGQRERIAALLSSWSGLCASDQPSHAFLFQELDIPGRESRGLFRADGSAKPVVSAYLATLPFPARTRDPLAPTLNAFCVDLFCEFEAMEWADNPFAEVACAWDFGDGAVASPECRTQHLFGSPGVRAVRLAVAVGGVTVQREELVIEPTSLCLDPEPPRAELRFPTAGLDVTGRVPVAFDVLDNLRLARVDFLVDGRVVDSGFARPFRFAWETGQFPTGLHDVAIRATDRCGNQGGAAAAGLFIDRRPPEVELLSPEPGARIAGRLSVSVRASDNRAVERVELRVDRRLRGTDREPPYEIPWHSARAVDGLHRLEVRAYDRAGNLSRPASRVVRVDNTPPRLHVNHPAAGQSVSGTAARISGWALEASGELALTFEVDGRDLDLLAPPEPVDRAEVCAAFATLADPRCPAVGYRAFFDPGLLPAGRHLLRVVATDPAGNETAVEVPFGSAGSLDSHLHP